LSGPESGVDPARPRLAAVVRRLTCSLLISTIIPSGLFYLCLRVGNVHVALVGALAWCYGTLSWRLATRRACPALLWVTAIGLTAKTAVTVATGSTFVYFLQPAISETAIALLFLVSLCGARPVVGRVASDFYPMTDEVASRPRIKRLFWHLTLMWAVLCLGQAALTVWLLERASLSTFVAARAGVTTTFAVGGAAVTVAFAVRIARSERLFHSAFVPV
jgi:hypothetical protein